MANLLGQNIGTNYKGILNLNTLNGNLSGTLQPVTDGDGNASPLQLSTTQASLGGITNPVFLFNGTNAAGAARNWAIALNQSYNGAFGISYSSTNGGSALSNVALTISNSGNIGVGFSTAASARVHVLGDGTNPILRLDNGAGAQVLRVDNSGNLFINSSVNQGIYTGLISISGALFASAGVLRITNDSGIDFNRLQFGGTTNAFPALKRNGAALEVRLADDSGFAAISASRLIVPEGGTVGVANGSRAITFDSTGATNLHTAFGGHRFSVFSGSAYVDFVTITGSTATPSVLVGTTSNVASSLFTIDSTTRGFLPPRMTETQRNTITTPAAGLIVYNTTTNLMNFYNGTIWMSF